MGIFFDQEWFDERLKASGLTRASMAQAAGMTIDEIEMVFRDQRELERDELQAIARVLASDPREVATRAGAADPGASSSPAMRPPIRAGAAPGEYVMSREVIAGIHERLDRLEKMLELVISRLDRR
jgi:hypothetical protein